MKLGAILSVLWLVSVLAAAVAYPGEQSLGATLADKEGCYECHAVGRTVVGPAFTQIAAKYRFDPSAKQTLADVIRLGGRGHWGERFNMWPHGDLTDTQAEALAEWVLEQ